MSKTMGNHRSGDADISDQNMKVWLEERIVRLALYRFELSSIEEQIEALDQHADSLQSRGRAIPEVEQQQRETLEGAYLSKQEEVQRAFEPCASHPFSLEEEMNIYCHMLIEVNERLAHQEEHQPQKRQKRPLRDLYNTEQEPPFQQQDEPERNR